MYAISLQSVSKTYRSYAHGWDQLWEILTHKVQVQCFHAVQDLTLYIPHGQVVGVVGKNGAGKSTLLKIVAGTLLSDEGGICEISGRVSALLELGSGFHPDMTGRENVFLSGAMMGFSVEQMNQVYDEIVDFSGIAEFMERPVKTYSSGMFVRLAFAVATCVKPDILIIDEALSVGDGAFARKSFDRIIEFQTANKTILFCSHSLYQVEKICNRVIWLDKGKIQMDGEPAEVLASYSEFLTKNDSNSLSSKLETIPIQKKSQIQKKPQISNKQGRITHTEVHIGSQVGEQLTLHSKQSNLMIDVDFIYDPSLLVPSVAVTIMRKDGLLVASASTHNDKQIISHRVDGTGQARIIFYQVPLLKGNYSVDIYLLCENALHLYDQALAVSSLTVLQEGIEQGVVHLQHEWYVDKG